MIAGFPRKEKLASFAEIHGVIGSVFGLVRPLAVFACPHVQNRCGAALLSNSARSKIKIGVEIDFFEDGYIYTAAVVLLLNTPASRLAYVCKLEFQMKPQGHPALPQQRIGLNL